MRYRPNRLATIISENIEPVLVRLDARPDVDQAALAAIASAVTKVSCARRVPDRQKRRNDTERVGILNKRAMSFPDTGDPRRMTHLEHDISTYDVWRKVVVLAVEHDRDGVVAVHLINEVIRVLGARGPSLMQAKWGATCTCRRC